ncbi:MAG: NAD(P)H-quinone oxidoreductase [Acidobacteriota bacterium]
MRAVVIEKFGPPDVLQVASRPDPSRRPGEVLVEVVAAGVNRADILQRLGHYPPPPGTPEDIPGLEISGRVLEADPGGAFAPGDRVMALLPGAGYADRAAIPAELCLPVPKVLSFEAAAAIPEAYLTAYDALFHRLHLTPGETVLIHAVSSGVGVAALQLAHCAGIRTIGTSRSPEKLQRAREMGLDVAVQAGDGADWPSRVREATNGTEVDGILDLVGAAYWPQNLEILRPQGRIVVVGLLAGRRTALDLGVLLRKRLTVVGTALRSRRLWEKAALIAEFRRTALGWFAAGRIRPVIDRVFPAAVASEAHRYLESNQHFGKVVLRWDAAA